MVANCPGNVWQRLDKALAPSHQDVRKILMDLRRELRWSRAMLAAVLGVPENSLRSWETGARSPHASAVRLIWLVDVIFRHPEQLRTAADMVFWGRAQELKLPAAA